MATLNIWEYSEAEQGSNLDPRQRCGIFVECETSRKIKVIGAIDFNGQTLVDGEFYRVEVTANSNIKPAIKAVLVCEWKSTSSGGCITNNDVFYRMKAARLVQTFSHKTCLSATGNWRFIKCDDGTCITGSLSAIRYKGSKSLVHGGIYAISNGNDASGQDAICARLEITTRWPQDKCKNQEVWTQLNVIKRVSWSSQVIEQFYDCESCEERKLASWKLCPQENYFNRGNAQINPPESVFAYSNNVNYVFARPMGLSSHTQIGKWPRVVFSVLTHKNPPVNTPTPSWRLPQELTGIYNLKGDSADCSPSEYRPDAMFKLCGSAYPRYFKFDTITLSSFAPNPLVAGTVYFIRVYPTNGGVLNAGTLGGDGFCYWAATYETKQAGYSSLSLSQTYMCVDDVIVGAETTCAQNTSLSVIDRAKTGFGISISNAR